MYSAFQISHTGERSLICQSDKTIEYTDTKDAFIILPHEDSGLDVIRVSKSIAAGIDIREEPAINYFTPNDLQQDKQWVVEIVTDRLVRTLRFNNVPVCTFTEVAGQGMMTFKDDDHQVTLFINPTIQIIAQGWAVGEATNTERTDETDQEPDRETPRIQGFDDGTD